MRDDSGNPVPIPDTYTSAEDLPWNHLRSQVERILIADTDAGFQNYMPKQLDYWFADMPYLSHINLTLLNTSGVTSLTGMFKNDRHLQRIYMEKDNNNNGKLYSSSTDFSKGMDVFTGCNKLLGYNHPETGTYDTSYESEKVSNYTYGRLNGMDSNKGYIT